MILLYRYDKASNEVLVIAMQDARSGGSALAG